MYKISLLDRFVNVTGNALDLISINMKAGPIYLISLFSFLSFYSMPSLFLSHWLAWLISE